MAAEQIGDWVSRTLEQHGSLFQYATTVPGHQVVQGRGKAYVLPLSPAAPGMGIVRWLRHGGLLKALTGDRFLALGRPRPLNELFTSVRLREQGIATPQVWAACVYPAAGFYRGEVLRAFHAEWTDLATLLFGRHTPLEEGSRALAEAAKLPARLAECGICHTDFNAMNLLVREDPDFGVMVIDLENAAGCLQGSKAARRRMEKRLAHSLSKLEGKSGRRLPEEIREVVETLKDHD